MMIIIIIIIRQSNLKQLWVFLRGYKLVEALREALKRQNIKSFLKRKEDMYVYLAFEDMF